VQFVVFIDVVIVSGMWRLVSLCSVSSTCGNVSRF